MRRELPVRPNLEHLKSQAKDLLEAFRRREQQDLHPVGCAVVLHAAIPQGDGTSIVVRGTHWIQLDALTSRSPYLLANVSPFAVDEAQSEHTQELERELR
jgi:Lon protease-like protein